PEGEFPDAIESTFYVGLCNHCDEPSCVSACPTGATYKDIDGRVLVESDLCIGCGYCVTACPYGARYLNPESQKVDKCDFCKTRMDAGAKEPACVEVCISDARIFGDLEDRNSELWQNLVHHDTRRIATEEVDLKPNVYYLGDEHHVRQILAHFPLKKELTEPPQPAQVWTRWILPLTAAAIGLSFSGQALAFFYQLYKGEPPTEE
ncbi:MAG: 4Fe-4S dicluster domain-containing protein, partial [Deltaproteobacteria bacterium]|nr:4Fe-4S dicluster domain-containing protein [Deltaproteobacteria bacterium]